MDSAHLSLNASVIFRRLIGITGSFRGTEFQERGLICLSRLLRHRVCLNQMLQSRRAYKPVNEIPMVKSIHSVTTLVTCTHQCSLNQKDERLCYRYSK